MTSQDPKREIQQAEAWFRSACVDETGPHIDSIKRRARLAIQEQWVAGQLDETADSNVAGNTKSYVRAFLSHANGQQEQAPTGAALTVSRRTHRMAWLGAASLAMAACLVIAVSLRQTEPPTPSLLLVVAFEQYEEDDFTQTIASLDQDLDDFEDAWDQSEATVDASGYFEELLDELDGKLNEAEGRDDWIQSVLEGTKQ